MGLSSLLPELEKYGVPLYGVVHQTGGSSDFKKYFGGELLYDKEVCKNFYLYMYMYMYMYMYVYVCGHNTATTLSRPTVAE